MINNEINGIINVYKETGFTSFDVVAKLKGMLKTRKIGHTGTLDPEAVGVLPICIGNATKVCELLMEDKKEYIAGLRLGIVTDTQDTSGEVLSSSKVEGSKEDIIAKLRDIVSSYTGDIMQLPPMYSALKVNGQKLYELARNGIEVERKPRKVHIEKIEILEKKPEGIFDWAGECVLEWKDVAVIGSGPVHRFYRDEESETDLLNTETNKPEDERVNDSSLVFIRVICSKGTYIRTLCEDIGKAYDQGGCMESLVRTYVGRFDIKSTYKLSELQKLIDCGNDLAMEGALVSVDRIFEEYRSVHVKEEGMKALCNGNQLQPYMIEELSDKVELKARECVRVYGTEGKFYGIYEYHSGWKVLKTVKMFI